MRFRSVSLAAAMLVSASVMQAQGGGAPADSRCTGPAANACQQAVDLFQYTAPLLGTAITGGNTTMGQGGTLGMRLGLIPHVTVGVRFNAVLGGFPEYPQPAPVIPPANTPSAPGAEVSTTKLPIGLPAVDAAIGVFKGIPLALSNVGGIDILLSAAYVPTIDKENVDITPESNFELGYGLRIGLLQESLLVPGLGVSFMKRGIPSTDITGTAGTASLTVADLDLSTTAWRITASKSLLLFGVALGAGQDKYSASTQISANMPLSGTIGPFPLSQEITRTSYFADVSMNLPFIKLVATGGQVTGGDIPTYYAYDKAADASRIYGSFGIRFTF